MATYIFVRESDKEEAREAAKNINLRFDAPAFGTGDNGLGFAFFEDSEHDRFARELTERLVDYDIQV